MTHRIVVNVETGVTTQVEYSAEEQAVYDAAVAQQETEIPTTQKTLVEQILASPADLAALKQALGI